MMLKLKSILCVFLVTCSTFVFADSKTTVRIGIIAGGLDTEATRYQVNEYMKLHLDVKVEIVKLPQSSSSKCCY